jgi:hypothetical protein
MQLDLSLGTSANVTARVDPVPAEPVYVLVQAAKSGIVRVPDMLLTGVDGQVIIPVRSTGLGSTSVTVALLDINGGASAILGINVTLGPGPAATSVVPAAGRASGDQPVRINGYNFSDHCAVSFGGVPAPAGTTQPVGDAIVLLTPPHDAGIVDIAIRCGTRSSVFPQAFVYQAAPVTLNFVSQKTGTTHGGTILTLKGVDFRFDLCSARFGQTEASPMPVRGSTISIGVASPPHEAGSVSVSLVCGSETSTLPGAFTYVATDDPPASLSSISGLSQGALALMEGSSFRRDDEILINGVVSPDVTTSVSFEHSFILPEITGQAEITLRDYAGREIVRTVTIAPPTVPAVTSLPDHITLGAEFLVTGTGLRRGLTYMLGQAPMPLISNQLFNSNDQAPLFRAPISVGPGPALFTIADHGTVLVTKSVTVTVSGPAVSAIEPPCAAFDGGSLVTIFGSGFDEGASVQFGTVQSMDVVVKDPFTIIARVPPSLSALQPQITVFNPDGSAATLTNAFSYKSAADGGCGSGRHRAAGH